MIGDIEFGETGIIRPCESLRYDKRKAKARKKRLRKQKKKTGA